MMATADDADLLAPLVDVQAVNASDAMLLFFGRGVELQVAGIDDWASFNDAVGVFQQWWEDRERTKNEIRKDEINKREDAIWDELTTNAKLKLEKAAEECKKSPNLADARKLVNQMLNGNRPFFKKFAEKFNQKYGADALQKIKAKLDQCNAAYKVDGVYWGVYHLTGTICSLDKSFTLNAEAGPISAAGAFVFSAAGASSGAWSYEGLMGGLKYNGSSTYQIEGVAEDAPVIVMNTGSNWSVTAPNLGTMPLGEGIHLGNGGDERIKLDSAPEECSPS